MLRCDGCTTTKVKFLFASGPQEAGEGHPVPDREGLRVGHTGGHRQVHPGAERTEQADDRGVPGQPAAVQQGRPRVSATSHHCCFSASLKIYLQLELNF